MLDVVVQRGDGSRAGPDIIDPLITSPYVAIARGTCEIDESTSYVDVQLVAFHTPGLKTGETIEVIDSTTGTFWRGKVCSIEISMDADTLIDTLIIKRPL